MNRQTPPASASDARGELPDPLQVPTDGFLGRPVAPPPSKSYSHRALNLAWLAGRRAEVHNLLEAEDTALFRRALTAAGWRLQERSSPHSGAVELELAPPPPSSAAAQTASARRPTDIFCGNAGTMFRFLAATLTVVPGEFLLDGSPRLRERPIGPLVAALEQLGATIEYVGGKGFAPLRIRGASLAGGRCTLDAGASSQYLSALMMAGAFAPRRLEIEVASLTSRSYVAVTLDAMRQAGIAVVRPSNGGFVVEPVSSAEGSAGLAGAEAPSVFRVEADDSAAAYPAAAAMITGRPVVLQGLRRQSIQGDRRFLDVLASMGAELRWRGEVLEVGGSVRRAVDVEMSSMPDQVPTLAAVAAFAPGTTTIRGAAHLRIKESDRLEAMTTELSKVGVAIRERPDGLVIEGDPRRCRQWPADQDAMIDPRGDHRIAMSLALVGLKRPRVWIHDPMTVAKSYPLFWRQLFGL